MTFKTMRLIEMRNFNHSNEWKWTLGRFFVCSLYMHMPCSLPYHAQIGREIPDTFQGYNL